MGPDEVGQGTEESVEPVAQSSHNGNENDGGGLNPAWNDLLQVVPSQLHSQVTPHLSKWDQNFQSKINEVHSQYAPFKPFIESQIQPEQINYALSLMQAIEERPLEVLNGLQEYAKQNGLLQDEQSGQQGQQVDESEIPQDFLQHPEVQKMQQMLQTMAQYLVQQQESQTAAQEDQQLESELSQLHQEHGEFDEDWVLTKAMQAMSTGQEVSSLKPFVEAYKQFEQGLIANSRRPGPRVMPSGGIAPNNQLDPKSLDDKGRRSLVAQMLQEAAQNSQ